MRHRGFWYGKPGDGFIALLLVIGIGALILPFAGAYKLVTGETEESKVIGAVMLVVGVILYIAAALQ